MFTKERERILPGIGVSPTPGKGLHIPFPVFLLSVTALFLFSPLRAAPILKLYQHSALRSGSRSSLSAPPYIPHSTLFSQPENAQLKTHIINYSKTREVYKEYKKSRHKKEYLAGHAEEVAKHEAAKAAFDALNGKPIPKVAQLSEEYAALLAEKKECYEESVSARAASSS